MSILALKRLSIEEPAALGSPRSPDVLLVPGTGSSSKPLFFMVEVFTCRRCADLPKNMSDMCEDWCMLYESV